MRTVLAPLLSLLLLGFACGARAAPAGPDRVLFVGNSLTYVGNLPAVFAALARANGHAVQAHMVAAPGSSLAERVADDSAARALRACRCNVVVLQERRGDLSGAHGPETLAQSRLALAALAALARTAQVSVVLLGTYGEPDASQDLVTLEGAAAAAAGIPYVAVAEALWRARAAHPSLRWLREPGAHPGETLTLFDAVLLYRQLYGSFPAATAFTVHAPIYGINATVRPVLMPANAPRGVSDTPHAVSYPADDIGKLLAALDPTDR